jgi:hypothetical protein
MSISQTLAQANPVAPSNLGILTSDASKGAAADAALPARASRDKVPSNGAEIATRFLETFDYFGRHNLIAIHPETGQIEGRTFPPSSWGEMRDWVVDHYDDWNQYFSVNEPKADAPDDKLSKDEIGRLRCAHVDIDPDKAIEGQPGGFDAERKRIWQAIQSIDPRYPPTFVIDSGGGYQVFWRLKLCPDRSTHGDVLEGLSKALGSNLGGDNTFNIDRVMRLPGTRNIPDAKKLARNRKPAIVRWIEPDGKAYFLDDLAQWVPPLPIPPKAAAVDVDIDMGAVAASPEYGDLPANLRTKFEDLRRDDPSVDRLWKGDRTARPGDDASGSGFAWALAIALRRTGNFTPTDFGQLLFVWDTQTPEKVSARYISRAWGRNEAFSAEEEFGPVEVVDRRTKPDDPTDLWDARRHREPPMLPTGCVPEFIESFAKDKSNRLGAEWSSVAVACIAGAGSLVPAGNTIHLHEHSDDWPVHPILWTALVGDSGSGKSPVHDIGMMFVSTVEKEWNAEFAKANDLYELAQPRKVAKKRNRDIASEEVPNLETIFAPPPIRRRKRTTDSTPEAMVTLLCENPAGMLYASDELAGWSGGMDAYKTRAGKDRPFWLAMKNGGPIAVDRKSGSVVAPFGAVSVFGTIQPEPLQEILRKTGDGLMQRFLFAFSRRLHDPRDLPADLLLNEKAKNLALVLAGTSNDKTYRLNVDARGELDAIHAFKNREISRLDNPPHLSEWVDKQPNEFGRLALIFHFIEWGSGIGPALEENPPERISLSTAQRARRFIEEFLYPNARLVFGRSNKNAEYGLKVAGFILAHEAKTVGERDLYRGPLKTHTEHIHAAMRFLEVEGWVTPSPAKPSKWTVNPAVHDGRFREIAEAERSRREEIARQIAEDAQAKAGT